MDSIFGYCFKVQGREIGILIRPSHGVNSLEFIGARREMCWKTIWTIGLKIIRMAIFHV